MLKRGRPIVSKELVIIRGLKALCYFVEARHRGYKAALHFAARAGRISQTEVKRSRAMWQSARRSSFYVVTRAPDAELPPGLCKMAGYPVGTMMRERFTVSKDLRPRHCRYTARGSSTR
jgi:hypothetical protein